MTLSQVLWMSSAALIIEGCGNPPTQVCNQIAPPALVVTLVNALDSTRICDAMVIARSGPTVLALAATGDGSLCDYRCLDTPPAGSYEVMAARPGFSDASAAGITLATNQTCRTSVQQSVTIEMHPK